MAADSPIFREVTVPGGSMTFTVDAARALDGPAWLGTYMTRLPNYCIVSISSPPSAGKLIASKIGARFMIVCSNWAG